MMAVLLALTLLWDFPRDHRPQPDRFVISYTMASGHTIEAMAVPPSSVEACASFPGADAETYCAQWPTCPPLGEVILFWMQAEWGETSSAKSNLLTCHVTAPCTCTSVDTAGMDAGIPARSGDSATHTPTAAAPASHAPTPGSLPGIHVTATTLPPLPAFNPSFPPTPA